MEGERDSDDTVKEEIDNSDKRCRGERKQAERGGEDGGWRKKRERGEGEGTDREKQASLPTDSEWVSFLIISIHSSNDSGLWWGWQFFIQGAHRGVKHYCSSLGYVCTINCLQRHPTKTQFEPRIDL